MAMVARDGAKEYEQLKGLRPMDFDRETELEIRKENLRDEPTIYGRSNQ